MSARIKELAREGAYDGVVFHRVIDGFMAQTGDVKFGKRGGKDFNPGRAGMGGSDKPDLKAEFSNMNHVRGTCSMARAQNPNSANSQFFICFDDAGFLNRQYTVWGQVIEGMENVDKIKRGEPVQDPDKIVSMKVAADVTNRRSDPGGTAMMGLFWSLLGMLSGAFIAIQAPINSQLARGLGLPVAAAAFSFLSGAIVLGIATLAVDAPAKASRSTGRRRRPGSSSSAACSAASYVTISTLLIPRIGAAALMAFLVAGQLLAGMAARPHRLPGHGGARDFARTRRRRRACCWPGRCSSG